MVLRVAVMILLFFFLDRNVQGQSHCEAGSSNESPRH